MTDPHVLYLDVGTVRAVHQEMVTRFGGLPGVRDDRLLESAVAQPAQTFDGTDLYPTVASKAACYVYGLTRDHPFIDGNKRCAAAVLGAFLEVNGLLFGPHEGEVADTVLAVAAGAMGLDAVGDR